MLTLLSCAKTMSEKASAEVPFTTVPQFRETARDNALQLAQLTPEELAKMLGTNAKIAVENKMRYLDFVVEGKTGTAALLAYTGIVFKRLNPSDFSDGDFRYAQDHLRLTSFLYGYLRPLDEIRLPEYGGLTMFEFWRERLTDLFISDIKAAGGVLCNLASDEMRGLFDWKRVEREVEVVTPEFRVWKDGKLKTIVVYTKMMRGEMTRYILKNRIESVADLAAFHSDEGFAYAPELSSQSKPVFTV